MKIKLMLVLLVICSASAALSQEIEVSKVRIIIEDEVYLWNSEGKPEKSGGHTAPSTIISFLSFYPGATMSEHDLEQELERSLLRLSQSGYFYTVEGFVVPPQKNPDQRTIVVRVTEGFRYRFGGSSSYVTIGLVNIFGLKKSIYLYGGYRYGAVKVVDYNFLETAFMLSADFLYEGVSDDYCDYTSIKASLYAGYNFTPALRIGSAVTTKKIEYKKSELPTTLYQASEKELYTILSPQLLYQNFFLNMKNPLHYELSAVYNYYSGFTFQSYEGAVTAKRLFFRYIEPGIKLSAGASSEQLPYSEKFDLYDTDDRSVRSGYLRSELVADQFLLFSSELRFHTYATTLLSLIPLSSELFLFGDLAYATLAEAKLLNSDLKSAFGPGVRLKFATPVFAYFTATYGWNSNGAGRFIFATTAGF